VTHTSAGRERSVIHAPVWPATHLTTFVITRAGTKGHKNPCGRASFRSPAGRDAGACAKRGGVSENSEALLDVRPAAAFGRGHVPASASIPLEELPRRVHELPPADARVTVIDDDPTRAARAVAFLQTRGHRVTSRILSADECTEVGLRGARLWRPSAFLAEALERIATISPPTAGARAVDVACGSGRDAVHLAMLGYAVDAIDVLPDAVARATELAASNGVGVNGIAQDLERDPSLPRDAYALVIVFRYLQRSLSPALRDAVAPGGFVVYETFHVRNRETGRPPRSPEHLLESGELTRAFEGLEIVIARDGVERDGRFFSQLLARRRI
jgi:tellurite methyltransferase